MSCALQIFAQGWFRRDDGGFATKMYIHENTIIVMSAQRVRDLGGCYAQQLPKMNCGCVKLCFGVSAFSLCSLPFIL